MKHRRRRVAYHHIRSWPHQWKRRCRVDAHRYFTKLNAPYTRLVKRYNRAMRGGLIFPRDEHVSGPAQERPREWTGRLAPYHDKSSSKSPGDQSKTYHVKDEVLAGKFCDSEMRVHIQACKGCNCKLGKHVRLVHMTLSHVLLTDTAWCRPWFAIVDTSTRVLAGYVRKTAIAAKVAECNSVGGLRRTPARRPAMASPPKVTPAAQARTDAKADTVVPRSPAVVVTVHVRPGMVVNIMADGGKYCSGASSITTRCTKSSGVGPGERFLVLNAGNGLIALKADKHHCGDLPTVAMPGKVIDCTVSMIPDAAKMKISYTKTRGATIEMKASGKRKTGVEFKCLSKCGGNLSHAKQSATEEEKLASLGETGSALHPAGWWM